MTSTANQGPRGLAGRQKATRQRVGELRPSQLLFTFGVGSLVDLPNLSVMVMGLNEWDPNYMTDVVEDRILAAVRRYLGPQVKNLYAPPVTPDSNGYNPYDPNAGVGVPVAPFPRWLRCPRCDTLAPINSGVFEIRRASRRLDGLRYVHLNCPKSRTPIPAIPVRFLIACENGHLDDFPWLSYAHRGVSVCSAPSLRLREFGASGEASDITVKCEACGAPPRRMGDALGGDDLDALPLCGGRRPHLRDRTDEVCDAKVRTILLGASNAWFPVTVSGLAIPRESDRLAQLVDEKWSLLTDFDSLGDLQKFRRRMPELRSLAEYDDASLWAEIERKRSQVSAPASEDPSDLKTPEWRLLSGDQAAPTTADFRLEPVSPPPGFESVIERVVLVSRLREVRSLVGFTRIQSPGDFGDMDEIPADQLVPLTRSDARWVPAVEVRGERIFIQFNEDAIAEWSADPSVVQRGREFFDAHKAWRLARRLKPVDGRYPGLRYLLIHSFSHALMRQLCVECGYSAASVRERIYAAEPDNPSGPAAGVLIYTAAPDSEGTLGGLVALGVPSRLARHLNQALEQITLCASDPLCSEHVPLEESPTLHGAACHACLFAPETSCERGNRYLDRSLLVRTLAPGAQPYFSVQSTF